MYHNRKKSIRTIVLPSGRGMLIQRLECGVMVICGPVDRAGCVIYDYAKWFSAGKGRRHSKIGGRR